MLALPLVLLPSLLPSLTLAKTPYVVAWNRTHSYGPDGPWPVVTVQVGSREDGGTLSWVDLHPGGIWQTMIPTEAFCNSPKSPNPCLAEKAGLYNLNSSTFLLRNFTNETATIWQWGSERAFNMSGLTNNVLDGMSLYTVQGGVTVGNGTISAVDRSQISLPDGTNYSTQVGSLSLGCPGGGSQAFEGTNFTGGTFPGKLRGVNVIASNSFGLHYGSVALGQVGSLVWGGYDQNRILGDVATFDLNNKNGMLSSLVDIQIGVETGLSPFGANVYEGLLRADPTFGGTQPTLINPVVPYFFMSKETCAAIAQNLPVTFQPSIGLYTWNIMDAQFEKIVRSPAFLGFIFQAKGGRNITIKVPFRLLNLTLEAPIVSSPQQYFPCRPFTNSEGNYFLGRAFLQAAYIGINWEISRWFLGQAPGPGSGASNIQSLGPNDLNISSDPIAKFPVTWKDSWTEIASNSTASPAQVRDPDPGSSDSGLSKGAKAGLGFGIAVGVLGFFGVVVLVRRRRRPKEVEKENDSTVTIQDNQVHEKDNMPYLETGPGLSHETGADNEIHEM